MQTVSNRSLSFTPPLRFATPKPRPTLRQASHRGSPEGPSEPSPQGRLNFAEAVQILKDGHQNPEEFPKARATLQAMMGEWPEVGPDTHVRLKIHEMDHLKRNRALVLGENLDAAKVLQHFAAYEKAAEVALLKDHANEACTQLKREKLSQVANAIRNQSQYTPDFDRLVGALNQLSREFKLERPMTDQELTLRRNEAQKNTLDMLTLLCKVASPETDPLFYETLYQNLKALAEQFHRPCPFSKAEYQNRRQPMLEFKKAKLTKGLRSPKIDLQHFKTSLHQLEMLCTENGSYQDGLKEFQALISEREAQLRCIALEAKEVIMRALGSEKGSESFKIPSFDLFSPLNRGMFAISIGKQLVENMNHQFLIPIELDQLYQLFCKLPRPAQVYCGYQKHHYLSTRKLLAQVYIDKILGNIDPLNPKRRDLPLRAKAVLSELGHHKDLQLPPGWTKDHLELLHDDSYRPLQLFIDSFRDQL